MNDFAWKLAVKIAKTTNKLLKNGKVLSTTLIANALDEDIRTALIEAEQRGFDKSTKIVKGFYGSTQLVPDEGVKRLAMDLSRAASSEKNEELRLLLMKAANVLKTAEAKGYQLGYADGAKNE
jgi:hypothetical protein